MDTSLQKRIKFMREIEKIINKVTGWAVTFVTPEGRPFCPLDVTILPSYCQSIVNNETGMERCIKSNKLASDKARIAGNVVNITCHAGIILMSAPVFVFEKYIGALTAGEGLIEKLSSKKLEKCWQSVSDLGISRDIFTKNITKLPIRPSQQFEDMAALLNTMALHFAQTLITSHLKRIQAEKERQLAEEAKARLTMEKAIKEIEYKTLQAKLNPHFLFNSLNAISRTAFFENASETEQMIYTLSRLLRVSLYSSNVRALHPLVQEVSLLNDYIYFQKRRFEDRLKTIIDISSDVMAHPIPVFLLQPIIENAICHGLEPLNKQVTIETKAYKKNGYLLVELSDNGAGMTKEVLKKIKNNKSSGLGLSLVKKRLEVQYDKKAVYKITSQSGKGTMVQIKIPLCESS